MRSATSFRVLDEVRRRVEHPRGEDLVVGDPRVAPDRPLVRVAGIRGLEEDRGRLRLQDDVDDPLQRDVEVVRALVVPPAEMQAYPVAGHLAERVVDRLDVHLRARDKLLVGDVLVHDVTPHGEVGRVDLEVQPGRDDRLVLGLHRVRERFEVLVPRAVVLVRLEEGDDPRRRRVHETAGDVGALECVREDGEVAPERLGMLVGDRAAADGAEVLGRRARLGEPVAEPGIGVEVGGGRARDVADLEAAEPVTDVGRVADLAHLAVTHEVDACVDLVAHALLDRFPDGALVGLTVDGLALVLGEDLVDDRLRSRQAADVRRQDAAVRRHGS